jgi:hypothetical protein
MSLTLVGSYTSANFSATSDGHGGTLITDPPISGGAVVTGAPGSASPFNPAATSSATAGGPQGRRVSQRGLLLRRNHAP